MTGANLGSSIAIATLYLLGPFGHDIVFALSFTIASNPVDKTAPNHSPSTNPRSTELGFLDKTASRIASTSSGDQPKVRTKSFPVPAGIKANGTCAGVIFAELDEAAHLHPLL